MSVLVSVWAKRDGLESWTGAASTILPSKPVPIVAPSIAGGNAATIAAPATAVPENDNRNVPSVSTPIRNRRRS
mgnify:CR=1 FL=1